MDLRLVMLLCVAALWGSAQGAASGEYIKCYELNEGQEQKVCFASVGKGSKNHRSVFHVISGYDK